jgi:formylglycine-generating enzyme required for sulfatase activity
VEADGGCNSADMRVALTLVAIVVGSSVVGQANLLPTSASGLESSAPGDIGKSAERLCAPYSGIPAVSADPKRPAGMVWIQGGSFLMGSNAL